MKNVIGSLLIIAGVIWLISIISLSVWANYNWDNNYFSYWNLADKSSTLEKKSEYINKFVDQLRKSNFQDKYDALIFRTNDNSCENNIQAVESLRDRLERVKTMDENSFEYQTAIQQITAQEQGEASGMMNNIESCYYNANFHYLWNIWGAINVIGPLVVAGVGIVVVAI